MFRNPVVVGGGTLAMSRLTPLSATEGARFTVANCSKQGLHRPA